MVEYQHDNWCNGYQGDMPFWQTVSCVKVVKPCRLSFNRCGSSLNMNVNIVCNVESSNDWTRNITLWTSLELMDMYLIIIFKTLLLEDHCDISIYFCSLFKWVCVSWAKWQWARKIFPVIVTRATRWHAPDCQMCITDKPLPNMLR